MLTVGARFASRVAGTVLFLTGLIGVVMLRSPLPLSPAAAGLPAGPEQLKASGAEGLDSALRAGGGGITFEVVQVSTLHTKAGGPRIELRSPDDQTKIIGETDEYQVGTAYSRGGVDHDVFWMEISVGPGAATFDKSSLFARVLERDGKLWRDDGIGWYVTDKSPGVGMDPTTARALAGALRSLDRAASLESQTLDGRTTQVVRGTSSPDAYPGVIASDGAAFTEKSFAVDGWFDEQGRLVRIASKARNLNQDTYDLIVTTTVTISYGSPGDPPDPSPTMAPEALPTSEPEAAEVKS